MAKSTKRLMRQWHLLMPVGFFMLLLHEFIKNTSKNARARRNQDELAFGSTETEKKMPINKALCCRSQYIPHVVYTQWLWQSASRL